MRFILSMRKKKEYIGPNFERDILKLIRNTTQKGESERTLG
jgi:hypothetical protein